MAVAAENAPAITATDNRTCANVSDMEGLNLEDLLGHDKWYYFHEDVRDCPVPASLADDYLAWAGMKDANGYIYALNNDGATYTIIGYEGSATELVLPETYKEKPVTKVGDRAFKGSAITYMTIPSCYTTIGTEAFADCTSLVYLNMGKGVASSYADWLKGCSKLASLIVNPDNTAYCAPNEKVLYDYAQTRLIRCSTLISGILTVPSSVTKIEVGAFMGCDKLNIVDLRQTTATWGNEPGWTLRGLNRNYPNNPIYGANPYTLFFLNEDSYTDNFLMGEPNIVVYDGSKYFCEILNIDDDREFTSPVTFEAKTANYNRKFTAALSYGVEEEEGGASDYVYKPKAYTLSLPFQPKIPSGEGLKLYRFSGVTTEDDVTTVSFEEVKGSTHSIYPYYLVAECEDPVSIYGSSASISTTDGGGGDYSYGNYEFRGTYVNIPNETLYDAAQPKYILQSDGNWHKVPQNQPKAFVPPFRAYFRAKSASAARALITSFGGDETGVSQTMVRTIDSDGTQNYYDLNGRRLTERPQQGIYIHNQKKYSAK